MTGISGGATARGTARFASRSTAAPGHFRPANGWTASSLGLGTFPGRDDGETDRGYAAAIRRALSSGANVLDTSIAYRNQRSERAIGGALAGLIAEGAVRRDEVILSSKAGFLPFDGEFPGGAGEYVEATFLRPGVVARDEIVAGGHCIAPGFLRHQLAASRGNLGCRTIDLYYLHNPETQLREVPRDRFLGRLRAAFEVLEQAVADGEIAAYGASTWSGFRALPEARDHLPLGDLVRAAVEVGGADHHFRAIMVPFNLALKEAFALENHLPRSGGRPVSLFAAAQDFGLIVVAGSSLHQARLARDLSTDLRTLLGDGPATDAQRALQFARSAPGVTTALFGAADPAHAAENLALARVPPLPEDRFRQLFDDPTGDRMP